MVGITPERVKTLVNLLRSRSSGGAPGALTPRQEGILLRSVGEARRATGPAE